MNDNLSAGGWIFATNATTVSALPASLAWGTGWAADYLVMAWAGIS